MTEVKQRFSVAQTFSDAMAILGARWKAMLGATVLMVAVMVAIYALFAWPLIEAMLANPMGYEAAVDPSAFGMAMLGGLVAMLVAVWLLIALLKLALEADAPRGIVASLAGALPRVPSAIGIAFCMLVMLIALYLAGAIVAAILTFIGVMMGEAAATLMVILSFCGILALLIYVMLGWVVAFPATVAESTGPIESLTRSWRLVKGNRLRLVALWVLTYVAVVILSLIAVFLTLPGFLAAAGGDPTAMQAEPPSTTALIVFFVINGLINIGVNLFFACLFAATYRNLVIANESAAPPATAAPEAG